MAQTNTEIHKRAVELARDQVEREYAQKLSSMNKQDLINELAIAQNEVRRGVMSHYRVAKCEFLFNLVNQDKGE